MKYIKGISKKLLSQENIDRMVSNFLDESALSDDDAQYVIEYFKFDKDTLLTLALETVGLAYGTSGRKIIDIIDDYEEDNWGKRALDL